MPFSLPARGLLVAGALAGALACAAPASAAVTGVTIQDPPKVGGVLYAGERSWFSGVAESDAPLEKVHYWITTTTGTAVVGADDERHLGDIRSASAFDLPGFPPVLVDGTEYVLEIRATEQGSATEYAFTQNFVYDGKAPVVALTSPGATTSDTTPLFAGTGETGDRARPSLHGTVYRGTDTTSYESIVGGFETTVGAGGTWSSDALVRHEGPYDPSTQTYEKTIAVTLEKGTYTVVASQCDSVYNCAYAKQTFEVVDPPASQPTGGPQPTTTGGGTQQTSAPAQPAGPSVRELQRVLLDDTTAFLKGDIKKVLKPVTLDATAPGPGTLATCVFVSRANASECLTGKAATASAAAKKKKKAKKKAKAPKNLLSRGAKKFAAVGTAKMKVTPVKGASKKMKGRKKAKVVVMTVFKPASGAVTSSTKTLTLKK